MKILKCAFFILCSLCTQEIIAMKALNAKQVAVANEMLDKKRENDEFVQELKEIIASIKQYGDLTDLEALKTDLKLQELKKKIPNDPNIEVLAKYVKEALDKTKTEDINRMFTSFSKRISGLRDLKLKIGQAEKGKDKQNAEHLYNDALQGCKKGISETFNKYEDFPLAKKKEKELENALSEVEKWQPEESKQTPSKKEEPLSYQEKNAAAQRVAKDFQTWAYQAPPLSMFTNLAKYYIDKVSNVFVSEKNTEIRKLYYKRLLDDYNDRPVNEKMGLSRDMKALAVQAGESGDGL